SYTAPGSGPIPVLINTCTSSFDTTLAVYTSCGGSLVASNDDNTGCGVGGSQVRFTSAAGQSYRIRVAGKAAARGTFTLHIEEGPSNGSAATAAAASAGVGTAGDNPGSLQYAF